MTILHLLGLFAVFLLLAMIVRKFLPIIILLLTTILIGMGLSFFFGFMPDYSNGFRAGLVQKYSVKGIFFKSNEFILVLPIEGLVMTEGKITVIEISCLPKKTPIACRELKKAVATREKILVEYNQWLRKPITQDSIYTVKSATPVDL
ncbi:MAG: hypothetical protein ACR2NY_06580 [Alphaproteobacteria bacterium]